MAGDYNLGTARGKLEIDASGAEAGAKKGTKAVGGFTDKLSSAGPGLVKVGASIGGVGVLIAGAFVGAVNKAAEFEKGLSAIQAVSGATTGEMEKVRAKALQIGKDTAFSATEASGAMEELIKAGLPIPDVLNGAADATVALAAAGEIALPEAAAIASNAMNQFSLSAKEMPKIADLIAGAANASAIDVGDFGHSLSQVGAVANLAGLSIQDTAIAIAEMGNAGIKGSDAGTSLKTMLSNLQPTTDKAKNLMQDLGIITEKAGNRFYDAQGNLKSLKDVQDILQKATSGLTAAQKQSALQTIFGSDAIRAAAILTKNGAKGYDDMAGAIGKVTAAQVAAARQNNLTGDIEKLKGSLETVAIQIGTILLPALRKLTQGLNKVVDWFSSLSDGTKKTIITIAGIIAVLAIIVGGFVALAGAIGIVLGALAPLAAAIGIGAAALLGWIAVIALIVVAVVVLVVLIVKNWTKIKDFTVKIWNSIVAFLKSVWQGVAGFFSSVGSSIAGFFVGLWNGIKATTMAVWNAIAGFFTGVWNGIVSAATATFNFLKNAILTIVNVVLAPWRALWSVFGGVITAAFNLVMAIVNLATKAIAFAVVWLVKQVISVVTGWANTIKAIFTAVWNFLVSITTTVFNKVNSIITTVLNKVKSVVTTVLNAIKSFFVTIFNAIASFVSSIWNAIYSRVAGPLNSIKNLISSGLTAAKNAAISAFTALANGVGAGITAAYNKVNSIVGKIRGIFSGAAGWLINAGKDVMQGFLRGLESMLNQVTGFFKKITDKIPDIKGPESKDKKLLRPAGKWIMTGFVDELQKGVVDVYKTLGGLTGALPTFVPVFADSVAAAGGTTALAAPPVAAQGNGATIVLNSYNPVGKTDAETLSDEVTRLATLGVL